MRVCDLPDIILEPVGFTADEWGTITTRVYNQGFVPPVITDTFIAKNADDVLLVNIGTGDAKDFEIDVPSINKTSRRYKIRFTERTLTVTEGEEEVFYHDMVFTIDVASYVYTGIALARADLHK